MQTIELNKKVTSIELIDDKIIINLEQKYIPEDGEYFYLETKSNYKYIGIKKEGKYITSNYCLYGIEDSMIYNYERMFFVNQIKEIRPATKEEIDLLNKALEKSGVRWNPETMQIEKLPTVGDFCIFWDDDKSKAKCGVLDEISPSLRFAYLINYNTYFKNCIRFQSAKHFKEFIEVGTIKK